MQKESTQGVAQAAHALEQTNTYEQFGRDRLNKKHTKPWQ
jgi:hypothetical protein